MPRLSAARIARGVGFLLTPILLVLSGGPLDQALAERKVACDFLTGAGEVHATGEGGVVRFGLAGGVKHGSFWGHLVYLDNDRGLKAESTSIRNYAERDHSTRILEGTVRTNLYGNLFFRVTVTNGHRGRHDGERGGHNGTHGGQDTFQIELGNGYFKHGSLFTGRVVLLPENLNSTPPAGFTCDQQVDGVPKGRTQ